MNSIYTSNGTLVVQEEIWSGVRKFIKNQDGKCSQFYKVHGKENFIKTGWGKKAKQSFDLALSRVKKELQA
jgi:hypothetical protein